MIHTQVPGLYINETDKKGRGIYCANDLPAGSLIELCPVILLDPKDTSIIHNTRLHDYYFIWDRTLKSSCIALGYGSLYNHSESPNAEFTNDYDSGMIRISSIRDIPAHEEICISYLAENEDEFKLWFDR